MVTETEPHIVLHLSLRESDRVWDYALPDDRELLAQLGPAILSHLGCSYEIKWPEQRDLNEIAAERAARYRREVDGAEDYAAQHIPHWARTDDRDDIRELLIQAYLAGHKASPKPVNYR